MRSLPLAASELRRGYAWGGGQLAERTVSLEMTEMLEMSSDSSADDIVYSGVYSGVRCGEA